MQPNELRRYYCVPCGTRGHYAGWAHCPTYLKETENFKLKQEKQQQRIDDYKERKNGHQWQLNQQDFEVSNPRERRKGPAPALTTGRERPIWVHRDDDEQDNQEQVRDSTENPWEMMNIEIRRIFGTDPMKLMSKIRNFIAQTRNMDDQDKAGAYFNFYASLCPK